MARNTTNYASALELPSLANIYSNVEKIKAARDVNKSNSFTLANQERKQRTNEQIAPMLKNRDYTGAANVAYDAGDVETGQQLDTKEAARKSAALTSSKDKLSILIDTQKYIAPAFYQASQIKDPVERQKAVQSHIKAAGSLIEDVDPGWMERANQKYGNADPNMLRIGAEAGLSMHDRLEQQRAKLDEEKFGYQQKHDAETMAARERERELSRNVTMRGQDLSAQNQPVEKVVGDNGQTTFVTRNQAVGKTPFVGNADSSGRPLPANAIDKITKAQGIKEAVDSFTSTFKDEYAGQPVMGGLVNKWGNIAGDDTGQASWWKNYQANKNETRNQLFGGALTPTEQAEYDKQDIDPGMSPGEIRKRLKRQSEIAAIGNKRLIENYGRGGYDIGGFKGEEQTQPQPQSQQGYVPFNRGR